MALDLNKIRANGNSNTPEFYYCSINNLRDEGVPAPALDPEDNPEGAVSDKRLQKIIVESSCLINRVTGQFFQPWAKIEFVNGTGNHILYTHYLDKIIHVNSVQKVGCPNNIENYDSSLYVKDERYIARSSNERGELYVKTAKFDDDSHSFHCPFGRGNRNWGIDGVFGNIKIKELIKYKLDSPITYGDTIIYLSSTVGLREEDYLVIGDQSFIINEIIDPSSIKIDPSLLDIPLESPHQEVYRWGRCHDDIRNACIRLVINRLYGPTSITDLNGDIVLPDSREFQARNIMSEKIDNYSYSFGRGNSPTERANKSLINGGTGDEYVDSILRRYLPPLYASVV